MAYVSMLGDIWTKLGDIVAGFFAIIPQAMYFLYAAVASILDMFQYIFRKIAGLEVYYVKGEAQSSEFVINLIEGLLGINKQYSALSTVFYSMVVFGVIVLILMTIFTIIKAHYNYDAKKASPSYIFKSTFKALASMVIVPLCTLLGLFLGSVIFKTLDSITSPGSSQVLSSIYEAEAIDGFAYATTGANNEGGRRYASYDFFGAKEWSSTQSFSGVMFEACANGANRVRYGAYTPNNSSGWDDAGVFYAEEVSNAKERVAQQIDYAFSNNLTLADSHTFQIAGKDEASAAIASSLTYGPSAGFAAGLVNAKSFSKYNVGLVWYYYNLWSFNFIVAFAGIFICLTLFSNVLFGMIMRIIMAAVLFVIYPPIVGITPFDEGNAGKSWRKEFLSYMVSSYAAVVGMNIVFLLLPVFNSITFFNISALDSIVRMIIIIAGIIMVKRFISLVASFVGAKNIDEIGSGLKQESTKPVKKAASAMIGVGIGAVGMVGLGKAIKKDIQESGIGKKIANSKVGKAVSGGLSKAKAKFLNTKFGKGAQKLTRATGDLVVKVGGKLKSAGQAVQKGYYKVKDKVNKALDNNAVKAIVSRLGIPVDPHDASEYEEFEEEDEDGNKVKVKRHVTTNEKGEKVVGEKKKEGLTIIKNAFLDLTNMTLKGIGDITGAKGMLENFSKNNKDLDRAKEEVNAFARLLNIKGGKPIFQTKQQEDEKEEEKALMGEDLHIELDSTISQATLQKVLEMIDDAKK